MADVQISVTVDSGQAVDALEGIIEATREAAARVIMAETGMSHAEALEEADRRQALYEDGDQ